MSQEMSGAQIVLKALVEQGVDTVFGYPGGSTLPIYDELFQQNSIRHILVRHEQGAVHAAEGYARSTGRPGVVLVTSGPGATNTITGLVNALLDSTPIVCLTGQVHTHLIGNDAFQEADVVGITRPCTKHNYLVKDTNDLARVIHEAFFVAVNGRPGPVVVDIPKDVQINPGRYEGPSKTGHRSYKPRVKGDAQAIRDAVALMKAAKKPILYTGGGVINSGPAASRLLRELVEITGFPLTSTLMGLGAYPASGKSWLGMLGMHGTYEANMAMHDCDVMVCIGARFDDRITGLVEAFAPDAEIIHIDIDPSSINKNIVVDLPIIGDVAHVLEEMVRIWRAKSGMDMKAQIAGWWKQIDGWKGRNCLSYTPLKDEIMPQQAIQRVLELSQGKDAYFTTEVGQHQMWAAQFLQFEEPNHWMTSGGLGTMGYGLPAAVGVQIAHPDALVIDIAGEASIQMTMQEMATAVQYRLPVKIFILNNRFMGMVRQWQELFHGSRYSESYSESLPDFVKMAEAFGATGIRASKPEELDEAILKMLNTDGPVIFDCVVHKVGNVYPMIPAGEPHNSMMLGTEAENLEPVGR